MKIEVNQIAIGFSPGPRLVQNISFSFSKGDFILIQGENGVGKTTLLRSLAGLQPILQGAALLPDKGQIGFAGADSVRLMPNFTGEEILSFFSDINESVLPSQVNDIELLGMLKPKTYQDMSSGMKQLLKVVICSYENKKVLLLDEPFRGLAEKARNDLAVYLKRISENRIVIVTDHSESNWKTEFTKRFIIQDGKWVVR